MKHSPALHLIRHVREYQGHQQGRSCDRVNHGVVDAVFLAIDYALRFDMKDFEKIVSWIRYSGVIESFYARMCGSVRGRSNLSAALSFEHWAHRKPFLIRDKGVKTPTRAYVGRRIDWYGERAEVTSFNDDAGLLLLCTYKPEPDGDVATQRKVAKRYRVSHDDVRDQHRAVEAWDAVIKEMLPASGALHATIHQWGQKTFAERWRAHGLTLSEVRQLREFAIKCGAIKPEKEAHASRATTEPECAAKGAGT